MASETEGFTGKIVGVVIATVIVAAVAVPVINESLDGVSGTVQTVISIIPVFLGLAIIMMVAKMFLNKEA